MADMNVRLIIINGVDNVATRPDVADGRARHFAAHPASKRRRKRNLASAFDQAPPRIHGSIPAPLSGVRAREPEVRLPGLPRLADFVVFSTAAELALGWHPFKHGLDGEGTHRGGTT
jgi:hypothetical protein